MKDLKFDEDWFQPVLNHIHCINSMQMNIHHILVTQESLDLKLKPVVSAIEDLNARCEKGFEENSRKIFNLHALSLRMREEDLKPCVDRLESLPLRIDNRIQPLLELLNGGIKT